MVAKKSSKKAPEIKIEMPDMGLTTKQITCLKKVFENALVATISGTAKASKKKFKFPPKTIVSKQPTPK